MTGQKDRNGCKKRLLFALIRMYYNGFFICIIN